jgi:hypothetical protein
MSITRFFSLLMIVLTLQTLLTSGVVSGIETEDPIIILFDEGHGQVFNSTVYTAAISNITGNESFEFYTTSSLLSEATLTGVDVLIITNVGQEASFTTEERYAIGKWLEQGKKGLFLLNNAYDENNETLSSNADKMNALLQDTDLAEGLGNLNPSTDLTIRQDRVYRLEGVNQIEEFTIDTSLENKTLLNLENSKVNSIYYEGSTVTGGLRVIQAGYSAFTIDSNGNYGLQNQNPTVMGSAVTSDQPDQNRIFLSGSSIIFSDELTDQGKSWYESSDNAILWNNIVKWLTFTEVPIEEVPDTPVEAYLVLPAMLAIAVIFMLIGWNYYKKGTLEESQKVRGLEKISTDDAREKDSEEETEVTKKSKKEADKQRQRLQQRLKSTKKTQKPRGRK